MTTWVEGVVVNNTHWTDNLFSLRIAADTAPFLAGQYTNLALDINGRKVAQPYSILSAPGNQPLEFFFYTQVEGDLSRALSRVKAGETVWVQQQPEGTLTLKQVANTEILCLMATGTGAAPFISMLQTPEPWQRFSHVVLVYAVRRLADLQYRELFDALQQRYPERFTLIPFISREKVSQDQLPGNLIGRIPASLGSGELEQQLGQTMTPANSHVMLCGNPGMVKDVTALLGARGFRQNTPSQSGQLSYESYW